MFVSGKGELHWQERERKQAQRTAEAEKQSAEEAAKAICGELMSKAERNRENAVKTVIELLKD